MTGLQEVWIFLTLMLVTLREEKRSDAHHKHIPNYRQHFNFDAIL